MKSKKGILYPIGIGHAREHITQQARDVLSTVDVVAGHYGFIELVREFINPKAMVLDDRDARRLAATFEECQQNRVAACAAQALSGKSVAVLSGGDSGIWGQAGVLLQAGQAHDWAFDVKVVPGIPSMVAVAARLGAPLMNGFSVISVGDEDTPFEVTEQRLRGAAIGGGTIVLYKLILENVAYPHLYPKDTYPELYPPKEKTWFRLERTFDILKEHIPSERPMAVVTDVHGQTSHYSAKTELLGNDNGNESIVVATLADFMNQAKGFRFFTTVIIGEEMTRQYGNLLVAPQVNYHWEYDPAMIDAVADLPWLAPQASYFKQMRK